MKVAIVGTGAAGAGTMLGLLQSDRNIEVDLFDAAQEQNLNRNQISRDWNQDEIKDLYRSIVVKNGYALPLPKSYLGHVPDRIRVNGKPRIWSSNYRGGLTNFWGATMLPLSEGDFEDWPFSKPSLDRYYKAILDTVGVSGQADGLSSLFGSYFNYPPLKIHPMLAPFVSTAHGRSAHQTGVHFGLNRIALDTRPGSKSGCVYCGECLIGCLRGAPFSTAHLIERWAAEGRFKTLSDRRVTHIDIDRSLLGIVDRKGNKQTVGPYDRIFLAAGCLGSTKILMASLDLSEARFCDSYVSITPILNTDRKTTSSPSNERFGLAQVVAALQGEDSNSVTAQFQFYPTLPHFWRSAAPVGLWGMARRAGRLLERRLFWARTYLSAPAAVRYRLVRDRTTENCEISMEGSDESQTLRRYALDELGKAMSANRFKVLSYLSISGGSSSHCGAADPFRLGGAIVDHDWKIGRSLFVVDSTSWPHMPATSPTFTIMANAMRTAEQAVS